MNNIDPKRYQDAQDKTNREAVNVASVVKVVSFDPNKMTVTVQPLSKFLENGEYKSQSQILDVPVSFTKSGGFIIRPWIKAGDLGLVVYVDHDIDKAVAGGAECEPNTERNHSTSDAVFVGAIVPGTSPAPGLPSEAVVISNDDGDVNIAIFQAEITATVKGSVLDITPDKISMTTQKVEIVAPNVDITGDVHITGTVTDDADVTAKGISLVNHVHGGITSGPSQTGKPQ